MFLHLHCMVPTPECIDHSVGRQNGQQGGSKLSEDPELGVSGDKQTGIPTRIPLRKCGPSWTPTSKGFQIAWVTFQFWSDTGTFWPSLPWKLLLPRTRPLPSHLGWNCRVSLWPGPRLGSHCSPASAWLCIPPLPCPALSSWNQSAHLLKKPLHPLSPGSCLPPRAAGLSFIAFLKFQISCLGCALRVRVLPHSRKEILTRVWRGQEGDNPLSQSLPSRHQFTETLPSPLDKNSQRMWNFCIYEEEMAYSSYETSPPLTPPRRPPPTFSYWSRNFHLKSGSCMIGIKDTFICVLNKCLKYFLLSVLIYAELR